MRDSLFWLINNVTSHYPPANWRRKEEGRERQNHKVIMQAAGRAHYQSKQRITWKANWIQLMH